MYKNAILRAALDATRNQFGDYSIENAAPVLSPSRAILEIADGKLINTYITSTSYDWEKSATPIRFPLRRGLSGFRLILIHKDNVDKFRKVSSKDDLKKFVSGTISVGSVARALMYHDFDIIKSPSFDGAFHMLAAKRFDFISRGVNEVYREIASDHPAFKHIVIAPDVAIHLPLRSYIFVSPKHPRLAERFARGMELIGSNGVFDAIFDEFHGESLRKTSLHSRRIIHLHNPNLPDTSLSKHEDMIIQFAQ